MAVPTLQITIPFPFSKVDAVSIHPSEETLISDIINLSIQLSKDQNQEIKGDYGLYLSESKRWLLPEAKAESYKEVFQKLKPNDLILLMPKKTVNITLICLSYKVTVKCCLEQTLFPIVKHAMKVFSKEIEDFFTGTDWLISSPDGEFPQSTLVKDILKYGNTFFIRRSISRIDKTDLPVFHQYIDNALARDGMTTMIPGFIKAAFDRIEKFSQKEGVFRKSGGQSHIEQIAKQIDETPDTEKCIALIETLDVHDTTGLLKYYFRNIPDPLLPFHFYKTFERLMKMEPSNDRKILLKQVLNTIPAPNFHILGRYVKCLIKVLEDSESNKMNINSLAICVAAVIMRNPDPNGDPFSTQNLSQQLVGDFIENYNYYFMNVPLKEKSNIGICIEDVTSELYVNANAGDEVLILDDNPKGYESYLFIEHNDQEGYVPKTSFEIKLKDMDDMNAIISVRDDKICDDTHLFLNDNSIEATEGCIEHTTKLSKAIDERILKLNELNKKLETLPKEEDPSQIIKEIEELMDLSFI